MAHSHVIAGEGITQAHPKVRKIALSDLSDALARGWDDFRAMPSHAVFLCLIYPIVGFVIFRFALGANVLPLSSATPGRERKNVTWIPKSRPRASRTQPVTYHHSVRKAGWLP